MHLRCNRTVEKYQNFFLKHLQSKVSTYIAHPLLLQAMFACWFFRFKLQLLANRCVLLHFSQLPKKNYSENIQYSPTHRSVPKLHKQLYSGEIINWQLFSFRAECWMLLLLVSYNGSVELPSASSKGVLLRGSPLKLTLFCPLCVTQILTQFWTYLIIWDVALAPSAGPSSLTIGNNNVGNNEHGRSQFAVKL